MTNQEASEIIKDGIEDMSLDFADEEQYEALTMAIKTLEKEPSGDLISRQEVIDAIENEYKDRCNELLAHEIVNIMAIIDEVPPTDPTKTAYWIDAGDYHTGTYGKVKCSCCHKYSLEKGNYCPNCGTRMEGESE